VTDSSGRPITDAVVTASILDVVGHIGFVPKARTDSDGAFTLPLRLGRYQITAEKPEDDYPPMYLGLYSGFIKQPEISVSEDVPNVSIMLKLEKKAAVVDGTVADAQTGAPINANARIECVDDPRRFLSGSGLTNAKFRLLIPSDCPVKLTVTKEGYAPWTFVRNGLAEPIRLGPDEVLPVEIKLVKNAAAE